MLVVNSVMLLTTGHSARVKYFILLLYAAGADDRHADVGDKQAPDLHFFIEPFF